MSDLVAWLEAALTAIEYVADEAIRASGPTWAVDGHEVTGVDTGHRVVADAYGNAGMSDSDMAHIALNDPCAVLARVEAERRLVAAYTTPDLDPAVMLDVLRVLAWGHRYDHPGWQPSWAPDGS